MSAPVYDGGTMQVVSATATVGAGPIDLIGFYVASTSSGTLVFRDGTGGTVVSGTITPAAGTFHRFPCQFSTSCHVTVANTISATFFFSKSKAIA